MGALYRTPLGDRKPHAGGHWLKTLRGLDRARIWWAQTTAAEEYEDALFSAFAAGVDASPEAAPRLADRTVILPFANLQTATDVRKAHGITGVVEPAPPALPVPGTTVVEFPAGSADGADDSAIVRPVVRRPPVAGRSPPSAAGSTARPSPAAATAAGLRGPAAREDLGALNEAVQTIACRRLVRELTVAEARRRARRDRLPARHPGRPRVGAARAAQGGRHRGRDPGPGSALDDPLHAQADLSSQAPERSAPGPQPSAAGRSAGRTT